DQPARLFPEGESRLLKLFKRKYPAAQPVVEIVSAVGDLVAIINNLGFQSWSETGVVFFSSLVRKVVLAFVFDDSLADLVSEVERSEIRVACFGLGHNPERLPVVIKSPVILHQLVQIFLARMTNGCVAQVMSQG